MASDYLVLRKIFPPSKGALIWALITDLYGVGEDVSHARWKNDTRSGHHAA
jgi:hypothetical protein